MDLDAEVSSLLRTIAQSHGSYHIALGGNTHAGTATLGALALDFLPQMIFGTLDFLRLRIFAYLLHDEVYLLQLQVNDIVHDTLSLLHVFLKQLMVEVGVLGEGITDIAVEIDTQQSARVVGTERYLAAGVGRHGAEAQVGIAVGDALAQDGVPEQHTGLGTLPGVVDNLLPQLLGRDVFLDEQTLLVGLAVDGPLLGVRLVLRSGTHEFVVNLHADVGSCHLTLGHLGINKGLGVRVLDAHGEHQRSTTSILCHLARTITITLHERHQACRRQGGVVDGGALWTDVAQVVTHTAATLHQLHLLLIDAQHGTVAIGIAIQSDDKAVGK